MVCVEKLRELLPLFLAGGPPIGAEHEAGNRRHVEIFVEKPLERTRTLLLGEMRSKDCDRPVTEIGNEFRRVISCTGQNG